MSSSRHLNCQDYACSLFSLYRENIYQSTRNLFICPLIVMYRPVREANNYQIIFSNYVINIYDAAYLRLGLCFCVLQ